MDDDLSIPEFLRATGPGTWHTTTTATTADTASNAPTRPPGIAPGAWEEMNKPEHREARALSAAVKQYRDEQRLAALEQWRLENPDLARMERKAKRDAARRINKLGIKATGTQRRKVR